jgi:hypothetical protein
MIGYITFHPVSTWVLAPDGCHRVAQFGGTPGGKSMEKCLGV